MRHFPVELLTMSGGDGSVIVMRALSTGAAVVGDPVDRQNAPCDTLDWRVIDLSDADRVDRRPQRGVSRGALQSTRGFRMVAEVEMDFGQRVLLARMAPWLRPVTEGKERGADPQLRDGGR